jgi:hypothetical protein
MTPWLIVLAVEAAGIVVLVLAARHLVGRAAHAFTPWRSLVGELRPALLELRAERDATRGRLEALRRRSTGSTQH